MKILLVMYQKGENVIDYGTYQLLVGIYSSMKNAKLARANFVKREFGITNEQYEELRKDTRKYWESQSGFNSVVISQHVADERELK